MSEYKSSWDVFWQAGFSTSCVTNGLDGYSPQLKKFWNEEVFTCVKPDDSVLDLCSGGGGIPELLIDYLTDPSIDISITATDLSIINKQNKTLRGTKLKYLSECNCEHLPFKENSHDLVTSSFGIEYSNLKDTLLEIVRVLKPKGYFATVLHCEDSEIYKNSLTQLKQSEMILSDLNFFELFKSFYHSKSKSKPFQKSAENKLIQCLDFIKRQMLHDNNNLAYKSILEMAGEIFELSQTQHISKTTQMIAQMETSFNHNYQRMKNLRDVVLSDQKIQGIQSLLSAHGFEKLFDKRISNQNKTFGHGLIFQSI